MIHSSDRTSTESGGFSTILRNSTIDSPSPYHRSSIFRQSVWTRSSCASRKTGARIKPAFIDSSFTGMPELGVTKLPTSGGSTYDFFLLYLFPFFLICWMVNRSQMKHGFFRLPFFCGAMIPCIWRVAGGVSRVNFYSLDANMNLQIILSCSGGLHLS